MFRISSDLSINKFLPHCPPFILHLVEEADNLEGVAFLLKYTSIIALMVFNCSCLDEV